MLDIEEKIEMKLYKITADNTKISNSYYMKLSGITSYKPSSFYE